MNIDHRLSYSTEDLISNVRNAIDAARLGRLGDFALYMDQAKQVLEKMSTQKVDRCRNCGVFDFMNQDRCCTRRCASFLEVQK